MADLLLPIMGRYTNFAMTSDGIPEIRALSYLPFESGYIDPTPANRLALVLVESRLIGSTGIASFRSSFLSSLQRLKGDLRAEGLLTRFIVADLYTGPVHKDGRIVLALRQFFKDVKSNFSNFEGAILIGNFPEASLVRKVSWRPGFANPEQLWINTEMISERADIVLSDLTGHWDAIYRQNDFDTENIFARPDAATRTTGWFDSESVRNVEFTSTDFEVIRSATFRDTFFMDDAIYTIRENRTTPSPLLRLRLNQSERNNEVDSSDRSMINIIARPDISISRINAFHIAVHPNPALTGTGGIGFLDGSGNPQMVPSAMPLFSGGQEDALFTQKDINFERQLIIDYLNRNHRFRNGAFALLPFRAAVISGSTDFNPNGFEPLVNAAATDFLPCHKVANADLRQYVQFLKTPAVLKYIMAHSNARISDFRGGYDLPAFTAETGGTPFRWAYRSGQYRPSFEEQGGRADIFVHRTLWHYQALQSAGASLVIHGGCNVNSVNESQQHLYTDPAYARWNNAEGFLFFTNCASLLSRAKGFNDAPGGFAEGFRLSDRANFGGCWKSYFNAQANDGGISTYNIQRKRPYFWSINGDWTLRVRNKNGFGILELDRQLRSVEVHPNRAWIDNWNFDAALNRIRGIGDIDGDGIDEFVITSDWGIGLFKYNGTHFRALLVAPRDTWFGGWRYDATVNSGRDRVMGVQNFTGTSRKEVMVWSTWGLATLEFNGTSFTPSRIKANGTRFGGWLLETANNTYCGSGKFDSDANHDMVLTSPWGLGIISLQNSNHVFMAPNGTRFGGWLLDTRNNSVRLVADFDGDGRDEILISSPWGIGILKMVGSTLTSVAMHSNGENIAGYIVQNTDNFRFADKLKGTSAKQIIVTNEAGIHVLSLSGGRLIRDVFLANGTRVDGWLVSTVDNTLQAAGDMNADGRAEFIIRSPWGVGIMGLDAATRFRCYSMFPYNTGLNDWTLQTGDIIIGSGNLSGTANKIELLITKSN